MQYYSIEELNELNEIIAFRSEKGIVCPECWNGSECNDPRVVITASEVSECKIRIRCSVCGNFVWE